MTFGVLLFDLDGTLVDTIPTWIEANVRTLKEFKYSMEKETFLREYYQQGLHFSGILEKCGLDPALGDRFYPNRDNLYTELLERGIEWIDDAGDILKELAQELPLGLMTGSRRSFIRAIDARLKITDLFKAIITYEDTGDRMKPDPCGLLLLAKKMEVKPASCLYIGDQGVDTAAAHAAGMRSCIIPSRETAEGATAGADIVLQTIKNLSKIVEGQI